RGGGGRGGAARVRRLGREASRVPGFGGTPEVVGAGARALRARPGDLGARVAVPDIPPERGDARRVRPPRRPFVLLAEGRRVLARGARAPGGRAAHAGGRARRPRPPPVERPARRARAV